MNPVTQARLPGRALSARRFVQQVIVLIAASALLACSGTALKKDLVRDPPSYAPAPATEGPLAAIADRMRARHGPEASGFYLLDSSYDGLAWRLALIDSAVSSVDVQTYLWYPDYSGRLLLDRVMRAAGRGVKVRLIVDDLLTVGLDRVLYEIQQQPNIELRIFNPWQDRGVLSRGRDFLVEMERLNTRMHDKLLIADGQAAIVGGRNIGDHYFGLSADYNFHDLDLLGFGDIAEQSNGMFDHFWNSEWVISAANIDLQQDPDFTDESLKQMREIIRTAPELEAFPRLPADWSRELAALEPQLHAGTSLLVYDQAEGDTVAQNVAGSLFPSMNKAQHELLITNAYIIPGQPAIDFLDNLSGRGVDVRVLTNSLSSHDVPAVNSHYKKWRDDLIEAGVDLFELRADPAIASIVNVPPVSGKFVGLHTKSFVIDRELSFVGSMNFDPRSININTEAGAFVRSKGLAEALAEMMLRDMSPENAWHVQMDEEGDLYWVDSEGRVDRQPARNAWQRIMDVFFMMFPEDQY